MLKIQIFGNFSPLETRSYRYSSLSDGDFYVENKYSV